jgi:hypothetical protein
MAEKELIPSYKYVNEQQQHNCQVKPTKADLSIL